MLIWDLPEGLPFDKPETSTGPWDYPPAAKFDRLLRHCRVPIGLLTNRRALRLFYTPHGESTGTISFKIEDMASVGGRPILDAFVMLLSATRFFGVAEEQQLPTLLAESRKRQANVTNELADQVFEALAILLDGFQAAAERDGWQSLNEALEREADHLYGGLLTVLLRLVFLLYAEDRDLLPVESDFYADNLSTLGLFDELQEDHGSFPDSMSRRSAPGAASSRSSALCSSERSTARSTFPRGRASSSTRTNILFSKGGALVEALRSSFPKIALASTSPPSTTRPSSASSKSSSSSRASAFPIGRSTSSRLEASTRP